MTEYNLDIKVNSMILELSKSIHKVQKETTEMFINAQSFRSDTIYQINVQESNVVLNENNSQCSISLFREVMDFGLSNPLKQTGLGIDCTLIKEINPNNKVVDIVFS